MDPDAAIDDANHWLDEGFDAIDAAMSAPTAEDAAAELYEAHELLMNAIQTLRQVQKWVARGGYTPRGYRQALRDAETLQAKHFHLREQLNKSW